MPFALLCFIASVFRSHFLPPPSQFCLLFLSFCCHTLCWSSRSTSNAWSTIRASLYHLFTTSFTIQALGPTQTYNGTKHQ
ncbi:hypothetical protein ABKN59_004755 [Abortiporus biennis]